jgi:hypothetical protein
VTRGAALTLSILLLLPLAALAQRGSGTILGTVTDAGSAVVPGATVTIVNICNDALDANSWANNRASRPKQPLRYNQYGGSIGGPIRLPGKVFGPLGYDGRDRSFFFYNYEGYQFIAILSRTTSSRLIALTRYRNSYYRQYTDQGTSNLYPDPVVRQRFDPFRGHNIVLSDIHNFTPSLIHEFRIGLARQIFDFKVASAGGNWPQQLGLPSIVPPDTFPAVSNGLPGFQTGTVGKRGGAVWQLFDSLTWLRGNHSFKFGTELRLTQANNLQKSSPSGSFGFPTTLTDNAAPVAGNRINTGNSFATFLLGAVGSASVTTHLGESEVGKAYGFYIND